MKYSNEEKNISSLFFKANKLLYKNIPNYTTASFDYTDIEEDLYNNHYPFHYRDFSKFGQYEFEYDIEDIGQHSLRYAFLYNDSPVHGNYQFYYSMDKLIHRHEQVLINKSNKLIKKYNNPYNNIVDSKSFNEIKIINNIQNIIRVNDIYGIIGSNYHKMINDRLNNSTTNNDLMLRRIGKEQIEQFAKDFLLVNHANSEIIKYDDIDFVENLISNQIEIIDDIETNNYITNNILSENIKFINKNSSVNDYIYKELKDFVNRTDSKDILIKNDKHIDRKYRNIDDYIDRDIVVNRISRELDVDNYQLSKFKAMKSHKTSDRLNNEFFNRVFKEFKDIDNIKDFKNINKSLKNIYNIIDDSSSKIIKDTKDIFNNKDVHQNHKNSGLIYNDKNETVTFKFPKILDILRDTFKVDALPKVLNKIQNTLNIYKDDFKLDIYSNKFGINKRNKNSEFYDNKFSINETYKNAEVDLNNEAYINKLFKVSDLDDLIISLSSYNKDIYKYSNELDVDKISKDLSIIQDVRINSLFKDIDINLVSNFASKINKNTSLDKDILAKKIEKKLFINKDILTYKLQGKDTVIENQEDLYTGTEKGKIYSLYIEDENLLDKIAGINSTNIQNIELAIKNNLSNNSNIIKEDEIELDKISDLKNSLYIKKDKSINKDIVNKYNNLYIEKDLQVNKNNKILKAFIENTGNKELNKIIKNSLIEKDILIDNVEKIHDIFLEEYVDIDIITERFASIKDSNKLSINNKREISLVDNSKEMNLDTIRKALIEYDEELKLKKRLWFIKGHGEIDYKIIPNEDNIFPAQINMFLDDITDYKFNYDVEIPKNSGLVMEFYNKEYKELGVIEFKQIKKRNGKFKNIKYDINYNKMNNERFIHLYLNIVIDKDDENVEYIILRHKKSKRGITTSYLASEEFIADKHPLPMGEDMGIKEIAIPIVVMTEFINILLLFWSKFYYAFSGYSGTQAIYGLVNLIYEWIMLEESQQEDGIEYYERCFRWFRWESEKVYQRAKQNLDYMGNYWIEEVIFELIDYMETHHYNVERYLNIHLQDEFRNIFSDPETDFSKTIDRVKGIRNRVLKKRNELD